MIENNRSLGMPDNMPNVGVNDQLPGTRDPDENLNVLIQEVKNIILSGQATVKELLDQGIPEDIISMVLDMIEQESSSNTLR